MIEVGAAIANEFAKSLFGGFAVLALHVASRSIASFWRVESNQTNVRLAVL